MSSYSILRWVERKEKEKEEKKKICFKYYLIIIGINILTFTELMLLKGQSTLKTSIKSSKLHTKFL